MFPYRQTANSCIRSTTPLVRPMPLPSLRGAVRWPKFPDRPTQYPTAPPRCLCTRREIFCTSRIPTLLTRRPVLVQLTEASTLFLLHLEAERWRKWPNRLLRLASIRYQSLWIPLEVLHIGRLLRP